MAFVSHTHTHTQAQIVLSRLMSARVSTLLYQLSPRGSPLLHSSLSNKFTIYCKRNLRNSVAVSLRMQSTTGCRLHTSDLAVIKAIPSAEKMYPHGMTSLSEPPKRMAAMIENLGHVEIQEFQPSKFVRPESVYYELHEEKRRWCVMNFRVPALQQAEPG